MTRSDLVSASVFFASLLVNACALDSNERAGVSTGGTACGAEALARGELAAPSAYPFVASVEIAGGVCTGALIAPNAILVAGHCVAGEHEELWVRSTRLCDAAAPCGPFEARVVRHESDDLAVLFLAESDGDAGPPIRILLDGDFTDFRFLGYGVGSHLDGSSSCPIPTAPGETLLAADFSVDWSDEGFFGSYVATDGPAVCSGDSGGPAITYSGGAPYLAGLLLESSSDGSPCTPDGGFQLWMRVAADWPWLRDTIGSCVELDADGHRFAECGPKTK